MISNVQWAIAKLFFENCTARSKSTGKTQDAEHTLEVRCWRLAIVKTNESKYS